MLAALGTVLFVSVLPARAADPAFARSVDLEKIRLIAVQHDGRLKTFDTLAREVVREIAGSSFYTRQIDGVEYKQDPVFTYLDLLFAREGYTNARLIYIKKKPVREAVVHAAGNHIDEATQKQILKDGLLSMGVLDLPEVQSKLDDLSRSVQTTGKEVDKLIAASSLSNPRALKELMRVVPPPAARSVDERWFSIGQLDRAPQDSMHAGMSAGGGIPGMDPAQQAKLRQYWVQAGQAWRSGDAAAASSALNELATSLAAVAPAVYPSHSKLGMEHWYYSRNKMTWTWIVYGLAVVFLLMGIVYRWPRAWKVGAGLYGLAFLLHTIASGIRWYVAGRIPNSNMFEAVTAAAWFGAAMAIFFELGPVLSRSRRAWQAFAATTAGGLLVFVLYLLAKGLSFSAWQQWGLVPKVALIAVPIGCMGLIASLTGRRIATGGLAMLAASCMAMLGLMCGQFVMANLSDISNNMPVLNDIWLYIHTNMIIASYMLIGMAYVMATMYVVGRLLTKPTSALWLTMLLPTLLIPLPGVAPYLRSIAARVMHHPAELPEADYMITMLPAWAPFAAVVVITLVCMAVRRVFGRRFAERWHAAWEGSGLPLGVAGIVGGGVRSVPPLTATATAVAPQPEVQQREGLARVLDGVTMLLLQLSFITLWIGIITGAIWADHSWGRPWGWDPKEVFALNTWIIFLILVHVRLKVREKALWTAALTVIGMAVMMFNWVVVNFFIFGLHSYAG